MDVKYAGKNAQKKTSAQQPRLLRAGEVGQVQNKQDLQSTLHNLS